MEKLIEILESINSKLLEFKEVLLNKQAALIHGKHEAVGEMVSLEQGLIAQIALLEQERIGELNSIKDRYSLSEETNKLEDLISLLGAYVSKEEMNKLISLRKSISSNNKLLKRINTQNMDLINNVRHFIRVLFTNIRDAKNSCLINAKV